MTAKMDGPDEGWSCHYCGIPLHLTTTEANGCLLVPDDGDVYVDDAGNTGPCLVLSDVSSVDHIASMPVSAPAKVDGPTTIALPCYGIVVTLTGDGGGTIQSELNDLADTSQSDWSDEPPNDFDAACDAIESLILAHACAGVDIAAPAYVEGIETAVDTFARILL